jgi:hypothetical protein
MKHNHNHNNAPSPQLVPVRFEFTNPTAKTVSLAGTFNHWQPDADIFRLALDIAQVPVRQIVYIENTALFVQVAEGFGIRSILHTDYKSTAAKLAAFGLQPGVIHETR